MSSATGYGRHMDDERYGQETDGRPGVPTANHPVHGERRPTWSPILGVLVLVVVVLGIFPLIHLASLRDLTIERRLG